MKSLIARLQIYFRSSAANRDDAEVPVVAPLLSSDPTHILSDNRSMFARIPLLACTSATFCPAAPVPGVGFIVLSSQSPLAAIQQNLDTNARGFDQAAPGATEAEATAFRAELIAGRGVTALLDGLPVAAGMVTPPIEGIAELAGITTLAPYRGQGIGAALTSELVRVAFMLGVDTAILSTENPIAARIYRRAGFQPVATLIVKRGSTSPT